MNPDEKQLVIDFKGGKIAAFNQLYKQYHSRVLQLAMRFLPCREDAEEILQVVFIALWNNRKSVDENRSFSAYILSIARHHIYNALRKAVYRQGFIDYMVNHSSNHSYITEEVVLYNELDSVLNKCVESLPPKRREIFRLFRDEGLSYKEISERLSITVSTVNTQLTQATDYIRKNIRLAYKE